TNMAFFRGPSYNLSDAGVSRRVNAAQVTYEMLEVLGLKPVIGRNFSPEEDSPGGPPVVLLSFELWHSMFQGDRDVLGHVLELDGNAYTVIGVLPREAMFPGRTDLWTPLAANPNVHSGYFVNGIGRLKPGVSIEQARADLQRIHTAMIPGHKLNEITSPLLTPLRDRYLGGFKTAGRVLMAAGGGVLLIACVNICALILVRGAARSAEFAIRTALGATPGRIVAQLITENLVLAVTGGVAGVLLGIACLHVLISLMADAIPPWISFSLDGRFA